jgi:uncharacterized protein
MTRRWSRTGRLLGVASLACTGVVAASAAAVAGSAAWPGVAGASGSCSKGSLSLSVQGRGTVTTPPDVLTLQLQVSASAPNPGQALQGDETATAAVVSALGAGGLAAKYIQTTDLSVEPTYGETGMVVTGYEADTTVVAKIHHFSSVAQLISQAVAAGGTDTTIESISFAATNPLAAQDQARSVAVRQAVGHAASMAKAAGERLGQLCSLKDESSTTATSPVPIYGPDATARSASPAQPIQQGTQTVTARVALVYSLVPERSRHRTGARASAAVAP